ncbi:MAG: high frequency lysogenization protein HflD [Methylococcaceae bacterium]
MNKSTQNQVLALAGIMQSVLLVQQIAKTGRAEPDDFLTCIESVLKIDADSMEAIFGERVYLRTGLEALVGQLKGKPDTDRELARYASVIIFHERQLMKNDERLRKVRTGIERAYRIAEQSDSLDQQVIAALAENYQETISPYPPRIMVQGEPRYLTHDKHGQSIRALLLSAIRSAVLWRQCGGSRFAMLFKRRNLQSEAQTLLDSFI